MGMLLTGESSIQSPDLIVAAASAAVTSLLLYAAFQSVIVLISLFSFRVILLINPGFRTSLKMLIFPYRQRKSEVRRLFDAHVKRHTRLQYPV